MLQNMWNHTVFQCHLFRARQTEDMLSNDVLTSFESILLYCAILCYIRFQTIFLYDFVLFPQKSAVILSYKYDNHFVLPILLLGVTNCKLYRTNGLNAYMQLSVAKCQERVVAVLYAMCYYRYIKLIRKR